MLYDEELLNSEQAKIDESYTQIGLRYYAYYKDNPAPEFADLIATITQSKMAIAAHRAEVLRANGKIVCPNCGQQINATAVFCNCCGLRIAPPAPVAPVAPAAPAAPAAPVVPAAPTIAVPVAAPGFSVPVPAVKQEEQPAAEEPVVEEPVTEEPVAEEPVVEEPVVEEPVAEEPVVEEPVAEEAVVEEPVAEEPVAEEPAIPQSWTCRRCGSVMPADCLFCMECGTRKEEEQSPAPAAVRDIYSDSAARVCKSCGFTVTDSEAMFCTNCGMRLEEASAPLSAAPVRSKRCPNCGFSTDDAEVLFCIECGTKLM